VRPSIARLQAGVIRDFTDGIGGKTAARPSLARCPAALGDWLWGEFGVEIDASDFNISAPAVIIHRSRSSSRASSDIPQRSRRRHWYGSV
jgi:hypothetical protein